MHCLILFCAQHFSLLSHFLFLWDQQHMSLQFTVHNILFMHWCQYLGCQTLSGLCLYILCLLMDTKSLFGACTFSLFSDFQFAFLFLCTCLALVIFIFYWDLCFVFRLKLNFLCIAARYRQDHGLIIVHRVFIPHDSCALGSFLWMLCALCIFLFLGLIDTLNFQL